VEWGALRRVEPVCRYWGLDRGVPIDRYYIESFLASHAGDIRGRVVEIEDNTYTTRFGGDRVTRCDALHVNEGYPGATIIADLTQADHIPSNSFDCFILTQTLMLIYDTRAALRTIHRILKPGGVVLATVAGITQVGDPEWASTWYWSFTKASARRLFAEAFGPANVQVQTFGNVLAATAFLQGLVVADLTGAELDVRDPEYEVTIAIRAVKESIAP
jgi:SAM-dependent methyltransferase